jgi:hypothetical protein
VADGAQEAMTQPVIVGARGDGGGSPEHSWQRSAVDTTLVAFT